MKVVYFNYLFDRKESSVGAAVHVQQFVKAATNLGVEVKAFCLNKYDGPEAATRTRARALLRAKLSRYLNELNAILANAGYFRKEWRIIRQEKPEVLLVRHNLLNFSAALIAKIRGIPLVLEVNAPMAYENRRFNQRVVHLPVLPELFERLNLRLASRVITVSQELKNYFVQNGISETKIAVVPNGVDVRAFRPDVDADTIRQRYGLNGNLVIGFIGSFHYWHGMEILPEYIASICSRFAQVQFLLVGSGPLKAELEQKMKDLGLAQRVCFSGYVPHHDIPQFLSAMDIVVAPYPKSGFFYFSPLKLFEYMAAGKAIVASHVGQIGEIIQHGTNGMLYDPDRQDELQKQTIQLIEDEELRRRVGEAAHATILNAFTWRHNAAAIRDILKSASQSR